MEAKKKISLCYSINRSLDLVKFCFHEHANVSHINILSYTITKKKQKVLKGNSEIYKSNKIFIFSIISPSICWAMMRIS